MKLDPNLCCMVFKCVHYYEQGDSYGCMILFHQGKDIVMLSEVSEDCPYVLEMTLMVEEKIEWQGGRCNGSE